MATQDLMGGRGFALIDPHGDLAEKVAARVAASGRRDVIYLNPADPKQPYGYNPLRQVRPEFISLRAFPFDRIKIDGSFKSVNSNGQAATIVRAVLGLGRGLGLPVLAEGVETDAELQFLQHELCDEVQGYLLGRPAAIGSFRNLTHADVASDAGDDPALRRAAQSA
jgi:hypothetical protein